MFKKIASIALAALMVTGSAAIAASAADVDEVVAASEESAVVGADAEETVGADADETVGADAGEAVSAANTFYFDSSTSGWNNYKRVLCYIYQYGGDSFWPWGSRKGEMKDSDGDGIYEFTLDTSQYNLDSSKEYAIIFVNENNAQCFDLLFSAECFGHTAYMDTSKVYENPADSNKSAVAGYWRDLDPTKYGPVLSISSIGNIVGEALRPSQTKYTLFVDFLKNTLSNAIKYNGKTEQQTIDDTAKELGLKLDDVKNAVAESGVNPKWDASASTLEGGSNDEVNVSGDGETKQQDSSSSGSSDSGSSDSGSSDSGSSDSGSSDSGSSDAGSDDSGSSDAGNIDSGSSDVESDDSGVVSDGGTSTTGDGGSSDGDGSVSSGQETTIFFVFGGAMLAAAGVIFLARKKRED